MLKKLQNFYSLYGFFLQHLYGFSRKSSGNTEVNGGSVEIFRGEWELIFWDYCRWFWLVDWLSDVLSHNTMQFLSVFSFCWECCVNDNWDSQILFRWQRVHHLNKNLIFLVSNVNEALVLPVLWGTNGHQWKKEILKYRKTDHGKTKRSIDHVWSKIYDRIEKSIFDDQSINRSWSKIDFL